MRFALLSRGSVYGWFAAGSCAALALAASAEVGAQDVSSAEVVLEELTVTARKREENVQNTPIAVSAFGERALQERNIQSAADITGYVPNVQFDSVATESGGGAATQIAIRGIGQTDYVLTVEPGVGIYLDGVYVGKSIGSLLDTVDIERLEVLRGPQGTLFGKNTLGGAIQLVSRRPGTEPELYSEVITGAFDRFDVRTGLSAPINDGLRLRFTGNYQSRDGHVKRMSAITGQDTGKRQGNKNQLSGRLVTEIDLADNLLATVAIDGSRIDEESAGGVVLKADENGGFSSLYNAAVPGGVCLPSAGAARFDNPLCYNSQYERSLSSRQSTNNNDDANRSEANIWGTSLTLDWTLEVFSVRSISAYRRVSVDILQELTGSAYYVDTIGQRIGTKQLSQELQLTGDALDDRLHFVAGAYYLHEEGEQRFPVDLTVVQLLTGGAIENDSYAAFSQVTYDLTEQLSLTGGLRYTHEVRAFNPEGQVLQGYNVSSATPVPGFVNPLTGAFGPAGTPLFPGGWYERTSDSTTPMASLNYLFGDAAMAYVSYAKGFKGGGFTMRYFPPVLPAPGTDPDSIVSYAGPETAVTYEVGLKSEWFDRRLRLNVAGFHTDYDDIQVTYNIDPDGAGPIGNFVPVLSNAASARIRGIELEGSLAATEWLRFDTAVGYVDAEYTHFSTLARANYPGIESAELPNTPEWTANIGGTLTFMDDSAGRLALRADYSYRSEQFKEFTNSPVLRQDAYGVLNAALTYATADEQWQATLGGTNLTDEAYMVSGVANPGTGFFQAAVSRPREWYLSLRYGFQ
jgi:iron complex outermembrane recepter protein